MEEIPRLLTALDQEPAIYARAAILMLLFTGCRRGEVLQAKWRDVDLVRKELHLPRTKSGKSRTVALSAPVVALLKELPREKDNPHVFPGLVEGGRLTTIREPWLKALKAAGLPPEIRVHDLRHSVGTSLSNANVSLTVVGAVLGHSQPSVTQRYAQPSQDPQRQALEDHARRIQQAVENTPPAEVVEIKKA
jgi:integrase